MSTDVDISVIQTTQKALGKYIKKPPLTEKLLRKPPFRFLHDIITSVVRETGFLKGLYSERELVSENVKEKEDKIAFLNKLIDAIKTIASVKLTVRAAKIIAGLEPQETNLLLQAVANALDRKLDSSAYIAELKSNKKPHKEPKPQVNDKKLKPDKSKTKLKTDVALDTEKIKHVPNNVKTEPGKKLVSKTKNKEKGSSSRDSKDSSRNNAAKVKSKISKLEKTENLVTPRENVSEVKVSENEIIPPLETNTNILIKEKADDPIANNEPETIIENNVPYNKVVEDDIGHVSKDSSNDVEDTKTDEASNPVSNNNIQIETVKLARPRTATLKKNKDLSNLVVPSAPQVDNIPEKPLPRPRSSLRPPTTRLSSARPGAPRLKLDSAVPEGEMIQLGKVNIIVDNFDSKEMDEEETVTIEAAPELDYQQPTIELPTDKGHLVDQILKQITKDELMEHTKPTVNIEWEQDGLLSRNAASKEVEQLRTTIQTLTRTANPLGKLVNYLHEDIEAMQSELEVWVNSTRQIIREIESHKKSSMESNKPSQKQLEELENNIVKYRQQVLASSGNIMRYEQRISELLSSKI